jgi:hypothetical protein
MRSLYQSIDLSQLEDPTKWDSINNNGFMIKEISAVQKIFSQYEGSSSNSEASFVTQLRNAVDIAIGKIVSALEKPAQYMMIEDYEVFFNYQQYLTLVIADKNLYFSTAGDQDDGK